MVVANENLVMADEKQTNNVECAELLGLENKKIIIKSSLRRIEVKELPSKLPDFKNSTGTKDNILAKWLEQWIQNGLKEGKLRKNDLLPRKSDLAFYLGISVGTVQNAIRFVEDSGCVESKQRIGTIIRNIDDTESQLRKQTSKRDQAIATLKKIIIKNGYKVGEALPSSRELAKLIGSASNTTRLALEHLASLDIIESKGCRGNKANWILKDIPEIDANADKNTDDTIRTNTLVDQLEKDLKEYISHNYKVNDKLPSHFELAEILKVSIKTVHDAMKRLIDQGILKSKRGRYGTFVVRIPSDTQMQPKLENSIFASASDASFYNYEKVERHLKLLIKENYKAGDKLPAMGKLSQELKVSSNTIRKALQNLSDQSIVKFARGRYGGTFITAIPKMEDTTSFTWLSVNPEFVSVYKTSK